MFKNIALRRSVLIKNFSFWLGNWNTSGLQKNSAAAQRSTQNILKVTEKHNRWTESKKTDVPLETNGLILHSQMLCRV